MPRKKLTKRELNKIERQLVALKDRLRDDLGARLGRVQNMIAEHPTELLDMASEGELDYMSAASAQAGSVTIEEIERALERLRQGAYGICEDCRRPIPKRRLAARPFAVLCVHCKERQERGCYAVGSSTISARNEADVNVRLDDGDDDRDEARSDHVFREVENMELSELF